MMKQASRGTKKKQKKKAKKLRIKRGKKLKKTEKGYSMDLLKHSEVKLSLFPNTVFDVALASDKKGASTSRKRKRFEVERGDFLKKEQNSYSLDLLMHLSVKLNAFPNLKMDYDLFFGSHRKKGTGPRESVMMMNLDDSTLAKLKGQPDEMLNALEADVRQQYSKDPSKEGGEVSLPNSLHLSLPNDSDDTHAAIGTLMRGMVARINRQQPPDKRYTLLPPTRNTLPDGNTYYSFLVRPQSNLTGKDLSEGADGLRQQEEVSPEVQQVSQEMEQALQATEQNLKEQVEYLVRSLNMVHQLEGTLGPEQGGKRLSAGIRKVFQLMGELDAIRQVPKAPLTDDLPEGDRLGEVLRTQKAFSLQLSQLESRLNQATERATAWMSS